MTDFSQLSHAELIEALQATSFLNRKLREENEKLSIETSVDHKTFSWPRDPDTSRAIQALKAGHLPVLVRDISRDVSSVDSFGVRVNEHLLIEGDNTVSSIAYLAAGGRKADVIYIDPPYNTGKSGSKDGFRYADCFINSDANNGFHHSRWLDFMYQRLLIAKELLAPWGVIIVAIGKQEVDHLGQLLDKVFARDNRVSLVTWAGSIKNTAGKVSDTSDYMWIYENRSST